MGEVKPWRGAAAAGSEAAPGTHASDLSQVFSYPSLGALFEGGSAQPLAEMRARLSRTHQDLERVVRQGPRDDAARAALAARAYGIAAALLDELERLRDGAK